MVSIKFARVLGRSIQWRARSNAASVPSNAPKSHKIQKRVSKDERRAMVESYVNKYREKHAGKFPSFSDAKKEVGGSYYVVRKIVQELEYKSKPPTGGMILDFERQYNPETVFINDVKEGRRDLIVGRNNLVEADGNASSILYTEKSHDSELKDAQTVHSDLVALDGPALARKINDEPHKIIEKCEDAKAVAGYSDFVAAESSLNKFDTKIVSDPCVDMKGDQKEHTEFEDPIHTEVQHESSEPDKDARDMDQTKQTKNGEKPQIPSLWGSLKTFAAEIFGGWRKR